MVWFSVLDFRHLICCYPVSCIFYVFFPFSACVRVGLEMPGVRLFLPAGEAGACFCRIQRDTEVAQGALGLSVPFCRVAFCGMGRVAFPTAAHSSRHPLGKPGSILMDISASCTRSWLEEDALKRASLVPVPCAGDVLRGTGCPWVLLGLLTARGVHR